MSLNISLNVREVLEEVEKKSAGSKVALGELGKIDFRARRLSNIKRSSPIPTSIVVSSASDSSLEAMEAH